MLKLLFIIYIRFHDLISAGEVELVLKGGRRELFPLISQAVDVLKRAIGQRTTGYVFINPRTGIRYKSIHKTFNKAVRKLGLTIDDGTKLRFHDLRYVFVTWLHKAGVSLDILRYLLCHRNRSTTDKYTTVVLLSTGAVLDLMP